MSQNLVNLVLALAYAPVVMMGVLWLTALGLRLAGKPGLAHWLAARTSVPQPEQNPPPASAGKERH